MVATIPTDLVSPTSEMGSHKPEIWRARPLNNQTDSQITNASHLPIDNS